MIYNSNILLIAAATLFFAIYLFAKLCSNRVFIIWPVFGMLPTLLANQHRLLEHLTNIVDNDKNTEWFHGPWLSGMTYLYTSNPENAKHMFNIHFSNYPKGDGLYEIFDVLGDGIFNVDGESWASQRKMAHYHMSHPRFKASVEERTGNKVANMLLPILDRMSETETVVDLSDIFMRLTFDITCDLVLGVDPGCLAFDFPLVPFAKGMDTIEQVLLFRHIVPTVWWKFLRWLRIGKEKTLIEAKEEVDNFIVLCIQKKRGSIINGSSESNIVEGPTDLLTPYMIQNDSNTKFLRDSLLAFLAAGKDTTGAALVWFFWLVCNNKRVENKILEELNGLKSCNNTDGSEMRVFESEETEAMVYLHAAVCEALRLYPSVPFNHKVALKADVLPSGHRVRAGTKIIYGLYSAGRMENIWGDDCLEFKPERWITEEGTLKHVPSYKFIAFHSGPRSCLGRSMAFFQMKLVTAAILYNFRVELVEGHVVEPKLSVVIQAKNGLLVKLKRRNSN